MGVVRGVRGRSSTWRIYARARAAYIRGRDSGADAFSTPSRRGGCVVYIYIYRRISSASRASEASCEASESWSSSSMGGLMMIDFRARKSSRHASARAYDRALSTSSRACVGAVWMEGKLCRRLARSFAVVARSRSRARVGCDRDASSTTRREGGCLFVGAI